MSSENGAFGAYLVGTYEVGRFGVGTIFHIINPTAEDREVIVAFFDDDEELVTCKKFHGKDRLSPNKMEEIIVPLQVQGLNPKNNFGVVKIISHRKAPPTPNNPDNNPKRREPVLGIVGFQRQVLPNPDWKSLQCFSETNLAAVPMKVDNVDIANEELQSIISRCGYP